MPVDIENNPSTPTCDSNCQFSFNYCDADPQSIMVSTSSNSLVNVYYKELCSSNSNKNNIQFKKNFYKFQQMLFVTPSVHTFNGSTAAAELIIIHRPLTTSTLLNVCIPITIAENSNNIPAAKYFEEISKTAQTGGGIVDTLPSFNLNNVIPKKKGFHYYPSTNKTLPGDFIVFDVDDSISINSATMDDLTSSITTTRITTSCLSNQLWRNTQGANYDGNPLIYISCQPTGKSQQKTPIVKTTTSSSRLKDKQEKLIQNICITAGMVLLIILLMVFFYPSKEVIKPTQP
jgi:carbonic anhydrase